MKSKKIFSSVLILAMLIAIAACIGISSYADDSASVMPTASSGQKIDVWLIAGQSNALGIAYNSNYPTDDAYADDKALLTNGSSNVWFFGSKDTKFVPAGFGQGNTTSSSGPEIGLTTALNGNGKQNAIIKLAYGNTSLYNNTTSNESIKYGTWTPPSYIEKYSINTLGNRTGDLYLSFMNQVNNGLKLLNDAGYTPVIRGLWWMQGEADTFGAASSGAYAELLETLISDMRRDLTEISGMDCGDMPFVYGRILRNADYDPTAYLTEVQAAQDEVAAKKLKNVYMINTTTDLIDPATGLQRDPVQQDSWHYDTLSQQMIGEAFIRQVGTVDGTVTKYGYVPSEYSDASSYPFTLFKRVDGYYVFDSAYDKDNYAAAMTRAITLTKSNDTAVTDEAVLLLRADVDTTSFLQHTSDIGETVTIDLDGHTFASRTSLCNTKTDDCLADGATVAKDGIINVKNGTLLMGNFGILYAAKNNTYTVEKKLTFNFENLNIGFAENASATCKTLLGIAYDSHVGSVVAKYEMNFKNCNIDAATNCPTISDFKIAKLAASTETEANGYNNAISITFKDCEIKAASIDHLDIPMSPEGDSVTFLKGDDGTYGKIILPTKTYSNTYIGNDDGENTAITYKATSTISDGYTTYNLVGAGDVETPYGTIPAASASASDYPFAIFSKTDNGNYAFDSVQKTIETANNRAIAITHSKTGTSEEAVILLRRDLTNGSYPSNATEIGGTITIDLNGHTLISNTTLFRTDIANCVADGETKQKKAVINIKNGTLINGNFGLLFNTAGSGYTMEKTFDFNIENVYFGLAEGMDKITEANKGVDLIISDRSAPSSLNAYFNFTIKNCTFDLITNARSEARLGNLDTTKPSSDPCTSDYNIEIIGGTFITNDITKINFRMSAEGDSFKLRKDVNGNYPKVVMPSNLVEPGSTYFFEGDGVPISVCESGNENCLYKTYEFHEGVSTPYGNIPYAVAQSGFAIFAKDSSANYIFKSAYSNWKTAFEAAAELTDGSSDAYAEAVVYLAHDISSSSVPQNASNICGTVTLDLGGNTLTVSGSFFNTWLRDGNSTTGIVNVKNGKLLTTKYGLVYSAPSTTSGDTYTKERTINVNFNNVYIGFGENTADGYIYLLTHAQNGSATVNTIINMNFIDCTIDLLNNIDNTARLGRAQTNVSATKNTSTVDYKLNFTSCDFLVHELSQLAFSAASEEGDSISYTKDASGSYPTVFTENTAQGFSAAEHIGIDNGEETTLILQYKESNSFYGIYGFIPKPDEITQSTSYAAITGSYVDTEAYPFALFYKDAAGEYVFKQGYDTYTNAMVAAISLTSASNADRTQEVVILLRCDWTGKNFPTGTSNIATKVTVDLGGFTLGAYESLCNTGTQDIKDANGNIVKTNGTIEYKNGAILANVHGLIYAASKGSYTSGYEKTITFNFNNVYIGFASGATTPTLVGRVASNHTTARNTININFTDCTLDMVTNRSTKSGLLIGDWVYSSTADYTDVNMTFSGCDFIGNTESDIQFDMTSGADSTVFGKSSNGNYASLTLPESASAPANEYALNGANAVFVKISEEAGSVTYRLRPKAVSEISFTPKMSITLDSELILNVYIPTSEILTEFTFDGMKYTAFDSLKFATVDGEDYYLIRTALSASSAARELKLIATVEYAESSYASVAFTFSIIKYAEKVLNSGADIEKQLVCDVISYIRAAYAYFGTDDGEAIKNIDKLLGKGYDENNTPALNGSADEPTLGLEGATLVLDATPAIRFYLPENADASLYSFYVDGKALNGELGSDYNGSYIELSVYAYAMGKTITYTIGGNEGGSYHINCYYTFVTTDEAYKSNAKLITLVERFAKYCESANAYKNFIEEVTA